MTANLVQKSSKMLCIGWAH